MSRSSPPPLSIPPLWRQNPTASGLLKRQADRRRWWIFVLLTCILSLAGALIGLLGWIRPLPHPYLFSLWVSSYQSRQISFLPWAEQDHSALNRGKYVSRVVNAPLGSQDRRTILQSLALLKTLLPSDTVVLYLNARACVGPSGEVTILPADADPTDIRTWVGLRQVLEALRASPARGKLLVLDLMKPQGETRPAVLDDDVASRVPVDLNAVDDSYRLTLTAAAPGQFSLTSEELGRSVFGYYFEEALRGWTELDQSPISRDGLVHVTEIADYVRGHVDRWARLNRGVRQEPTLHGVGPDFPVLALKHGQLEPALPLPAPADYPAWLSAGWSIRDRWRADKNERTAPLAFRQLEESLMAAEAEWRGGIDPARVQQDRMADLPIYQDLLEQVKSTPRPKPSSLAMAAAQGWTQNPALAAAAMEVLAKPSTVPKAESPSAEKPAATAKPAAPAPTPAPDPATAFAEKSRGASMLDLASAIFDAVKEADPTRQTILLMDGLLREQQPEPLFVETLFLRQLADRALNSEDSDWPTDTVRRALKVTSQAELANSRSEALAWLREPLEEAAQLRHDAEVILRAKGFAAVEDADRLLRMAESLYTEILEQQGVILEARDQWLAALHFLPPSLDISPVPTIGQDPWQVTAGKAIALQEALALPSEVLSGQSPLPGDEARRRIEVLQACSESLRLDLEGLRGAYSDASLAALVAQARAPRAGPDAYRAIDAALGSPVPTAKQRSALWRAGRDLAQRLLDQTLRLDRSPLDRDSIPMSVQAASRQGYIRKLTDRARRRIRLLSLAGLPRSQADTLTAQVAKAAKGGDDASGWWALERELRTAWEEGASEKVPKPGESIRGNLLNPLVTPPWSLAFSDSTPRGWFYTTWLREQHALWSWLAGVYDYEGADLGGVPFYRTAARELRAMSGNNSPASVSSPWLAPNPLTPLSVESPAATESLSLRVSPESTDVAPTDVAILLADPTWLRVGTASTVLKRVGGAGAEEGRPGGSFVLTPSPTSPALRQFALRVELDPEAVQSDTPPPLGFLVRAKVGGRDFHLAIPLSLQLDSGRLQLLLSADPKVPTDPQSDLGLRAIKDRQPYYLYLRNPTKQPGDVLVELRVGDQPLPGAPPRVLVAPGSIVRVPFPPGAIKPDGPLPELTGPLQVVLRRATDKDSVLSQTTVGVRIAAPAEYVRVSRVEYAPASPGGATDSRLSVAVQTEGELAGPPAVARLVLPPDQIPGLLTMGNGTMRGVLPADGKPLLLFVKGLRRLPGVDSAGTFYVQVDAYPRGIAFRATFPMEGQPTLPMEDARPALRLRAASPTPATATYPVRAEVDNPAPGSTLEVVLGRSQSGSFEPEEVRRFPTAQQHRIGFAPGGPDGALLFEAAADDWTTTLDLTGIEGSRVLRARLLDGGGNEVQMVTQSLLIDDSLPVGPGFVELPGQARRGSKLRVKATARATDSGIDHVRFFVGRPPAAGAPLPPTVSTTPGSPDPEGDGVWSAELALPDLKGPTDVAAQFESGAGKTSYATGTIELLDTDPVSPGRIVGTVMEGPRPQPGLVVILSQAPPKATPTTPEARTKAARNPEPPERTEIARATTTADGSYRFDNLAPGKYHLATKKDASLTKAESEVTVSAGAATTVILELFR